ncbi:MAG: sugar phosphate isomerase/epimerase family protein [Cyanobacteria bacterium P01_A01_bin.114]
MKTHSSTHQTVAACTWLFGHLNHRQIAERVARLGLDGVELLADIDRESPTELRELYAQAGLAIVSLTPDNVNIAHVDAAERDRAVSYYERLIAFASAVGSPRVTCHEQVGPAYMSDSLDTPEAEWPRLVESCRHLAEVAAAQDISLVFEPLHSGLVNQVNRASQLCRLVDAIAHPALSAVLDTYHLHVAEADPAAAIQHCGNRVSAVQLAAAHRRPPGDRPSPWLSRCLTTLEQIGFDGPWILECSTQLPGPSLVSRAIDAERVDRELATSLRWLRSQWASG